MANNLRITLNRSAIGRTRGQRGALKSLGLTKREKTVIKVDSPSLRGQIDKVSHLITVETVSE